MTRYIVFIMMMFFGSSTLCAQKDRSVLEGYLLMAAENNPGLKAKFADYMAAVQQVPQVGALPDPQFAFGYFIAPVETRLGPQRASLSLSQAFPWFGTLGARKDAASEMALARYELFEEQRSNLFFEVKTAYYDYYFMHRAIEITKENIEILRVFKNLSLVKIESGHASLADELRVELELNDLENRLAVLIDAKHLYHTRFNNLLNRDETVQIEIPEQMQELSAPFTALAMLDSVMDANRGLKSLEHRLKSFMSQEQAAQKSGLPKFNVGINYLIIGENENVSVADNGKDAILFPTVGLNIPIYRKKYKAMIEEAGHLQEGALARIEEKRNSLLNIFEQNQKDYRDSERRIALNRKQAKIASKVLEILISAYSNNSSDFEEVLRIERQLLGYQLAEQRALIDKNISVAFMDYLLGN